jgi:hypothetical protein
MEESILNIGRNKTNLRIRTNDLLKNKLIKIKKRRLFTYSFFNVIFIEKIANSCNKINVDLLAHQNIEL